MLLLTFILQLALVDFLLLITALPPMSAFPLQPVTPSMSGLSEIPIPLRNVCIGTDLCDAQDVLVDQDVRFFDASRRAYLVRYSFHVLYVRFSITSRMPEMSIGSTLLGNRLEYTMSITIHMSKAASLIYNGHSRLMMHNNHF